MVKKIYIVTMMTGKTLRFITDFTLNDYPIVILGDDGNEHETPYTTMNFKSSRFQNAHLRTAQALILDMGEDFWLREGAPVTKDEHGVMLYDSVPASKYIESQISFWMRADDYHVNKMREGDED